MAIQSPESEYVSDERAMMTLEDLHEGELVVAQIVAQNRIEFRRPFGDVCAVRVGRVCEDSMLFKNV